LYHEKISSFMPPGDRQKPDLGSCTADFLPKNEEILPVLHPAKTQNKKPLFAAVCS